MVEVDGWNIKKRIDLSNDGAAYRIKSKQTTKTPPLASKYTISYLNLTDQLLCALKGGS